MKYRPKLTSVISWNNLRFDKEKLKKKDSFMAVYSVD